MKIAIFLFCLLSPIIVYSQEYKDTSYSIREFTCSCKYNLNEQDDNGIFDRSAKSAYYPGGEDEWKKFAKKNLDKGFKGKHTVEVRFQVDKNGDLSGYTLLSTAPAQKYEEVVRVLKLSGKWFPSIQDGFCVKSLVSLSLEL
ncbi:MAG: hypothetical protein JNM19_10115 [Chitinophagaceae bacterium]|nr:hypothetical protein [Chitinophagaceae bacterium]